MAKRGDGSESGLTSIASGVLQRRSSKNSAKAPADTHRLGNKRVEVDDKSNGECYEYFEGGSYVNWNKVYVPIFWHSRHKESSRSKSSAKSSGSMLTALLLNIIEKDMKRNASSECKQYLEKIVKSFSEKALIDSIRIECQERGHATAIINKLLRNARNGLYDILKKDGENVTLRGRLKCLMLAALVACTEWALPESDRYSLNNVKKKYGPLFRKYPGEKQIDLLSSSQEWFSIHRITNLIATMARMMTPKAHKTAIFYAAVFLGGIPLKKYSHGGDMAPHSRRIYDVVFITECEDLSVKSLIPVKRRNFKRGSHVAHREDRGSSSSSSSSSAAASSSASNVRSRGNKRLKVDLSLSTSFEILPFTSPRSTGLMQNENEIEAHDEMYPSPSDGMGSSREKDAFTVLSTDIATHGNPSPGPSFNIFDDDFFLTSS